MRIIHGIRSYALERAVKLEYIAVNPSRACILPRKEKKEIQHLTEKEIKAFLAEIEGEPLKELFTFTLFTGMRLGEVAGFPWDAVDFINGTVTVKQQLYELSKAELKSGVQRIGTPKSGKPRTITVAPFVMDLLRKVKEEQAANQLEVGSAWNNQYNLVFTNKTGVFFSHSVINKCFKKIATKIGRPDARFHDLRHTYAVISLQEGDSPKTVQQNLGHATANFTLDVYAHVSEKMKQDSANRMQAFHNKLKA